MSVSGIMKREAEAGAMTGSGGPTSPHKRYRQGDDELRLLIPSKVSIIDRCVTKLSKSTITYAKIQNMILYSRIITHVYCQKFEILIENVYCV